MSATTHPSEQPGEITLYRCWDEMSQHQPALAALLLLLPATQPLPQQEAFAARRCARRGASRPMRGGVLVAGRRDLDGRQLEVLLGSGAGKIGGRTSAFLQLPLAGNAGNAGNVPHAAHLEAFASERRRGRAGAHRAVRHCIASVIRVQRVVDRDAHLERRQSQALTHGPN